MGAMGVNKEKIKIAFLTISLRRGGAERVISTLAHNMTNFEHILVLYGDGNGYAYKGKKYFLDTSKDRIKMNPGKVFRFLRRVLSLKRIVDREKVDVIVSFLPRPNILSIFLKKMAFFKKALIINEVTPRYKKLKSYEKFLMKLLYRYSRKIVVPSNGIKQKLVDNFSIPEGRITVIYNPIDVGSIERLSLERLEDSAFWKDKPTIISAGRLTEEKGFSYLLDAFSRVRRSMNCQLVILGDGELEGKLNNLAKELSIDKDTHFLGWRSNPFPYFRKADAFVLSSLWEGFGNVLVEAMCCALPVISFDSPTGPREIIGDNLYGILVPLKDTHALARGLIDILTNKEIRNYYVAQGLKRSRDFDAKRITEIWEKEINDCLR
jgi:glycosyltransferase involved in cell wall biosynthesis